MRSAQMPREKIATFLEVFGRLKQTVLWKFEDESLDNVPSNLFVRKWMPQSDILAHKNVILFITHGGMFGTTEGVHRGVPMLVTPLYGDQHRNGERAESYGYGRVLKFKDITTNGLFEFITEMTTNKAYYNRAKYLSNIMQDNLVHPMEEAMFWIEYVARHKGAKHLKSHAVKMSWFSYILLDILTVILLVGFSILLGAYMIFKKLRKSSQNEIKSKKA